MDHKTSGWLLLALWSLTLTVAGGVAVLAILAAQSIQTNAEIGARLKITPSDVFRVVDASAGDIKKIRADVDAMNSRIVGITRWERFLRANPELVDPDDPLTPKGE